MKENPLAVPEAEKEVVREELDLSDIYLLAAKYMARNRGIVSTDLLNKMQDTTLAEYQRERLLEPAAHES